MTHRLAQIIKEAESLPPDEQLSLIAHLAEQNRRAWHEPRSARTWRELRGMARPSLLGEDAQGWVSRTRREADERPQS